MANNVREAVQIVLDRIESHPEDFEYGGRLYWLRGILDGKEGGPLSKDERDALARAWHEAQYKKFHVQVLKSLLDENPAGELGLQELESAVKAMQVQGSSLKPTKLIMNRAQVDVAKKLGLTPEEYVHVTSTLAQKTPLLK